MCHSLSSVVSSILRQVLHLMLSPLHAFGFQEVKRLAPQQASCRGLQNSAISLATVRCGRGDLVSIATFVTKADSWADLLQQDCDSSANIINFVPACGNENCGNGRRHG